MKINDGFMNEMLFYTKMKANEKDDRNTFDNKLKQAIKDYNDEYLTGLTDEEREKIKEEIARYLEKNKVKNDKDMEALRSFVEGLLKKYGFKGDLEEAASQFAIEGINNIEDESTNINSNENYTNNSSHSNYYEYIYNRMIS